jgi:hypothetical protein
VQHFGENDRAERRHLAGFDHHGATGRQCRRKLGSDLIHRPVPRRDEAADAERLAYDPGAPHHMLELIGLQHAAGLLEMFQRGLHLNLLREPKRRAHLLDDLIASAMSKNE